MSDGAMFSVAADTYDRYVGRYSPDLAAGLIAVAGVREGMDVLDVGCGPGALATALAAVVGEERVTAVDPSEGFAATCAERLPRATVRVAGGEALPFPDGSFDAVLAQLVVNFMRDPVGGVREMARVTRPGGRVAACVWDYGGEMTLIRTFFDAAAAVDPAAAAHDERDMVGAREGDLARILEDAGLRDVESGALVAHADYRDFDDLLAPLAGGVGPAGAYYTSLDDDGRTKVAAEFRRRLGAGDEPFTLSARAWYAAGTAPG